VQQQVQQLQQVQDVTQVSDGCRQVRCDRHRQAEWTQAKGMDAGKRDGDALHHHAFVINVMTAGVTNDNEDVLPWQVHCMLPPVITS
jgi:hypothetical protein